MGRYTNLLSTIFLGNIVGSALAAVAGNGSPPPSATGILSRGIDALGGADALAAIKGISYHSNLLRTNTLEQSKTPQSPDMAVVVQGTQTISYDFSGSSSDIVQRIDKLYTVSNGLNYGRPSLEPFDLSIVVRGGVNGYACYVKGNEHVSNPPNSTFGYTDAFLTNVLVRDAIRLSPKLLLDLQSSRGLSAEFIYYHEAGPYPAVHDSRLNLTVLFDPKSYLPFVVRAYENHRIFGPSTNDFVLSNYTVVSGVQVPQAVHTLYNEQSLMGHTMRDVIRVNLNFPSGYFQGLDAAQISQTSSKLSPTPAQVSTEYDAAEIVEYNGNLHWYGPYQGSLQTMNVSKPVAELPNLYHLVFQGSVYTCTIGVFKNAIIVTDAPPHQSKLVIQWIRQTFRRNPTHLLLSHHHHDHSYGTADFVAAGAALVVPKAYKYYWQNIPGVKFALVDENLPFVYKDNDMQVRAMWRPGFVHSDDWMYFMWTTACPSANSPMVATIADAWSPGLVGYQFDNSLAISYLDYALKDRMPYNYLVVPIHGRPTNVSELYNATGYAYPNYKTTDFKQGGPLC